MDLIISYKNTSDISFPQPVTYSKAGRALCCMCKANGRTVVTGCFSLSFCLMWHLWVWFWCDLSICPGLLSSVCVRHVADDMEEPYLKPGSSSRPLTQAYQSRTAFSGTHAAVCCYSFTPRVTDLRAVCLHRRLRTIHYLTGTASGCACA